MKRYFSLSLLVPAALLFGGAASAQTFDPNLRLVIGTDVPIYADPSNPYQIIVDNYESDNVPGLHVNNLLVEFRLLGNNGFSLTSTTSTPGLVAPDAQWSLYPSGQSPVSFDVTVTADVVGFFPDQVAPYETNTHLQGYFLKVAPGGAGEQAIAGTIEEASAGLSGYVRGYLDDGSGVPIESSLLTGHVDSGLVQGLPVDDLVDHWAPFAPSDVPGYSLMRLTQVEKVMSITLGDHDGMRLPVSGTITVTLVPEPSAFATVGILGVCLAGCVWRRRRRKSQAAYGVTMCDVGLHVSHRDNIRCVSFPVP